MLCGTYRNKVWFIGSGVLEAGYRTVVGEWLKQSGMFWSVGGASSVLNFWTRLLSQRFEAFWKERVASKAAYNHTRTVTA